MVRRVLMFAYHFPPVAGSSGVQRTLKFSRYLPDFGWEASVVTVRPVAYERSDPGQLADIDPRTRVVRTLALDARRHLSLAGRYPGVVARPDRWVSWLPFAVAAGLREVRRGGVDCLWSTFPIPTAHLAARTVQRRTGLPWVADFRDSMTEDNHPADPGLRALFRRIEASVAHEARRCVFTTPGTLAMYTERYPQAAPRFAVIENAFDEENFTQAQARAREAEPQRRGAPLRLVHAGVLYPSERDPSRFFAALARLRDRGVIDASGVRVVLRATGHDDLHAAAIAAAGLADIVELAPALPYVEALAEMLAADALLLFQASNCNHQVPAKLYEYFRARRPILALTDPAGDTAAVLAREEVGSVLPLDDEEAIVAGLPAFLERVRAGAEPAAGDAVVARNTRRARSEVLAALLDEVMAQAGR